MIRLSPAWLLLALPLVLVVAALFVVVLLAASLIAPFFGRPRISSRRAPQPEIRQPAAFAEDLDAPRKAASPTPKPATIEAEFHHVQT